MTGWFGRLLLIILMLETGVVLIVVPWSTYWERNAILEWVPALEGLLMNHFVRGAVSGLGAINVCVGLFDLAMLVLGRTLGQRGGPWPPSTGAGASVPGADDDVRA